MYKICIIGSSPERFSDPDKIRRAIEQTIDKLGYQYKDVVFRVRGTIGVGMWSAQECLEQGYKYHLFISFNPEDTSKHWYDYQQKDLMEQYNNANSLTICHPQGGCDTESYISPIKDANFVVCFWAGEKNSQTATGIRYALDNNKIVLDGLNGLSLITNKNLRKTKVK